MYRTREPGSLESDFQSSVSVQVNGKKYKILFNFDIVNPNECDEEHIEVVGVCDDETALSIDLSSFLARRLYQLAKLDILAVAIYELRVLESYVVVDELFDSTHSKPTDESLLD